MEENENNFQTTQSETSKKEKQGSIALTWRSVVVLVFMLALVAAVSGGVFGFIAGTNSAELMAKFFKRSASDPVEQAVILEKIISEDAAITNVVEKSSPAVVSIIVSKNVPTARDFGMPFGFGFLPDLDGDPSFDDSQNFQKQQIGGGTGFFVSADGMIITNRHVVSDTSAEYSVITSDGKEYAAIALARDPSQDIAIIKIEGNDFPVLQLGDSSSLKIGQTVIAIGNSLGEFSNTVSRGIISGLKRNLTAGSALGGQRERLTNIVQTDAAINPGNSGGPLIDIQGNVIGVNVAMAEGAQNIGFALPIDQVKKVILQVQQTGKISAPFLGVRYLPVDDLLQKENNLPFNYGVLIQRGQTLADLAVIPGSPADKAGIMENDIILEVNGEKIDINNQLTDLLTKYDVGDTLTLKIWHRGDTNDVRVTLEEREN